MPVSARRPKPSPFAALVGVYRFRSKVDGCTIWYALNDRRQIIAIRMVPTGASDAAAVVDLAELAYGSASLAPIMTLHRPGASLPPADAASLIRLARAQAAAARAVPPALTVSGPS